MNYYEYEAAKAIYSAWAEHCLKPIRFYGTDIQPKPEPFDSLDLVDQRRWLYVAEALERCLTPRIRRERSRP